MTLYLGDFLIEDSVEWVLGDIVFKSTSEQPKQKPSLNSLYAVSYEEKPEIKVRYFVTDCKGLAAPMIVSKALAAPMIVSYQFANG